MLYKYTFVLGNVNHELVFVFFRSTIIVVYLVISTVEYNENASMYKQQILVADNKLEFWRDSRPTTAKIYDL